MAASTRLTPEQRTLRARAGAYALHAMGGTSTRHATDAFLAGFRRQVEAAAAERGEALTADEIDRRARFARRAHMARLALRSSIARSKARGTGRAGGEPAA